MKLSVVIPVKGDTENLARCLHHLRSGIRTPDETIVVDDGSEVPIRVDEDAVRVIRLDRNRGPSMARNEGAGHASGDVLVFIDADVYVREHTLRETARAFEEDGEKALVGVFEDHRDYRRFCSDYKNLWMKYSYETCPRRAALFYTSFAAIRADVFTEAGGFDVRYDRPSTEDTAFGNTLWEMGVRPLIAPHVTVFHNKEYRLGSLLKTDLVRASDLLKMKLRGSMGKMVDKSRTSVSGGAMLSVLGTLVAVAAGVIVHPVPGLALLVLAALLNYRFLVWLHRKRGVLFTVKSMLFMVLDNLVVCIGLVRGLVAFAAGRRV